MPNQEAETIANAITTGWVYRHGLPRIMISDQAPNVDGDKIRDLLAKFGIEKRHSSPYHPQGDDQAERGIRTTKQVMRCVLTERNIESNSWSSLLPEISYIINSVPNSSTKYTPYKVFYGTDPKLLSTALVEIEIPLRFDSAQEWVADITETEELINQSVNDNLGHARNVMKRNYDVGKSTSQIVVGKFMLVRNETRKDCLDSLDHPGRRKSSRFY